MLTQELVRSLFKYEESTGELRWRVRRQGVYKGKPCRSLDRDGYRRVKINGKSYRVHRVIWLYVYGYLPENQIDHIDKIKINNRVSNLREASAFCSSQNRDNFKNNTSGVKGVSWSKSEKKWKVTIMLNNVSKHGGYYKNLEEAVAIRLALEQCIGYSGCYNESPAYRFIYGK